MAGATTAQIMEVTGHRDSKSLRRYTRRELLHDPLLPKLFEPNSAEPNGRPSRIVFPPFGDFFTSVASSSRSHSSRHECALYPKSDRTVPSVTMDRGFSSKAVGDSSQRRDPAENP